VGSNCNKADELRRNLCRLPTIFYQTTVVWQREWRRKERRHQIG